MDDETPIDDIDKDETTEETTNADVEIRIFGRELRLTARKHSRADKKLKLALARIKNEFQEIYTLFD